MSGEPTSLASAKFNANAKQLELDIANKSVETLQTVYEAETDEAKKQEIFAALAIAKTEKKIVEAKVDVEVVEEV